MKLLAKVAIVATLGAGATILAAPNGHDDAALLLHARSTRTQMASDYQELERIKIKAKYAKDLIKLNCINDKLVQAKPQLNIADAALRDVEAGHEASNIQLDTAANSVRSLLEQARQCVDTKAIISVSSNSFSSGGVKGSDPGIPDPGIEPGGYASPPGM